MPNFFRAFDVVIRNIHKLLNQPLQANEFAMLSNDGDNSEDVHTYVLEAVVDLAAGEGPLFEGAFHASQKLKPIIIVVSESKSPRFSMSRDL